MSKRGVTNSWHLEAELAKQEGKPLLTVHGLKNCQQAVDLAVKLANALGSPVKVSNVTKEGPKKLLAESISWVWPD